MGNNYSKAFYLATPYAFTVSLAYLFSYWSTFQINILEYISLSDVIRLSIYPIVVANLSVMIGLIFGTFQGYAISKRNEKEQKHSMKWVYGSLVLFCIILIVTDRYHLWFIGSLLVALLLSVLIIRNTNITQVLPSVSQNIKIALFTIIIVLPFLGFAYGKINAHHILIGHKTRFAKASIFKDNNLLNQNDKLKFLGIAGDYIIFLSEDNSRYFIVKTNQIPILELSKPSYVETDLLRKIFKTNK